ncbi:TetR/AcrR family transcriptional regulator [Paludibacter jiangxiensis]|uniref:DNA-binding transcriptional regulator, AcrR family n=1 Tax=Paludibacter jiangxiensis TaxID=681398 RepID=A0A161L8X6_9BACT|nr:TetR/AcrR family transcriptional regulator [Paludibacter jiangxiensis]GAT63754.1 DNA-binding transcriptional regulator, AcrR family [Paludibacter jiangxiensis]
MINDQLSKEEQLRKEIISTAQKLFQQYGLHKTTMEDIARAMGKGKSTLYYYYKSKEEIFDAVLRTEMNEVYHLSKEAVHQAESASDKLKAFFSLSFQIAKSKVNLYKIVTEEMAIQDLSRTHHVVKELNAKSVAMVEDIFIAGFVSGEFCDELRSQAHLLAYSMVSAMRSLVLDMAIDDQIPDWDTRLNVLLEFLIKALRK